jgi:hypothetical protein
VIPGENILKYEPNVKINLEIPKKMMEEFCFGISATGLRRPKAGNRADISVVTSEAYSVQHV